MQETWVRSLGGDDPLKEEMATHSSILACEIPWTLEPGELKVSPWGHNLSDLTEQQSTQVEWGGVGMRLWKKTVKFQSCHIVSR